MTLKCSTFDWHKETGNGKGLGSLKLKSYPPSSAASICFIPAVNSFAARACDAVGGLSFVGTQGEESNSGDGAKTSKPETRLEISQGVCAPQSNRHLHNNWFTVIRGAYAPLCKSRLEGGKGQRQWKDTLG